LDGHNSHLTLEVVHEAKSIGLDLLTFPSHTSHALQSLDVVVFKPFKQYFREYRDFWTSRNLDQPATKTTLVHWVSLALRKALTMNNIRKGFSATGIFPINRLAIQSQMLPSEAYGNCKDAIEGGEYVILSLPLCEEGSPSLELAIGAECEDMARGNGNPSAGSDEGNTEAKLALQPSAETEHFFVSVESSEQGSAGEAIDVDGPVSEQVSITKFLALPTITARINSKT
jgi:hypothetical protein